MVSVAGGRTQQNSRFDRRGSVTTCLRGKNVARQRLCDRRSQRHAVVDRPGRATTVQDVIDRINSNADNVPPVITAQLARVGQRDRAHRRSVGPGTLSVQTPKAASRPSTWVSWRAGQTQSDPADVASRRRKSGAYKAKTATRSKPTACSTRCCALRTALETNNDEEIGRSLERLDADINRLNFARAEIGGRLQNLDVIDFALAGRKRAAAGSAVAGYRRRPGRSDLPADGPPVCLRGFAAQLCQLDADVAVKLSLSRKVCRPGVVACRRASFG